MPHTLLVSASTAAALRPGNGLPHGAPRPPRRPASSFPRPPGERDRDVRPDPRARYFPFAQRVQEAFGRTALRGVALVGDAVDVGGEGPLPDVVLAVLTACLPPVVRSALAGRRRTVEAELRRASGAHVELHVVPAGWLFDPPPTPFLVDLAARHRILLGPADLLAQLEGPEPAEIPAVEGPRLLLRATVRLLELQDALALTYDAGAAARLARTLRAAALAAGDACLIAAGRYHPLPDVRAERAAEDVLPAAVRAAYLAALPPPRRPAPPLLAAERWDALGHAADLILQSLRLIERERLGVDPLAAAAYREAVLSEAEATWLDRVRDLRDIGLAGALLPLRGSREARLQAVLPRVLVGLGASAGPAGALPGEDWLDPSRTLGDAVATLDSADLGQTFVRRWAALP
jgi:hypothetical protein